MLSFNWTFGMFLGYVLASWVDYYLVPYVSAAFNIIFVLIFLWFPESSDYLAHIQQTEKAKKAYAFYGNHRTSVEAKPELDSKHNSISWSDFQDPAVRRGCTIAFILIFFADTCGVFTITNFMTELMHWAQIEVLDVYVATVGLGFLQILGCGMSVFCMDRYGRRILFMISAVLSSLSMFAFAFYFYMLKNNSHYFSQVIELQWFPIISLALGILAFSLAIGAAPFFMISELLPTKLRGRITTIALAASWVVAFAVVQSFRYLIDWIGVHGTYSVYASFCMMEAFFVYFYLPETKNLTIDEIQIKLAGKTRK